MHASFPEETSLLQSAFATMGGISGAYVLGDTLRGLQWHIFVAQSDAAIAEHKPVSLVCLPLVVSSRSCASPFVIGQAQCAGT